MRVCVGAAVREAEGAKATAALAVEGCAPGEAVERLLAARASSVHHRGDLVARAHQLLLLRVLVCLYRLAALFTRLSRVRGPDLRLVAQGSALEAIRLPAFDALVMDRIASYPPEHVVAAGVRAAAKVLRVGTQALVREHIEVALRQIIAVILAQRRLDGDGGVRLSALCTAEGALIDCAFTDMSLHHVDEAVGTDAVVALASAGEASLNWHVFTADDAHEGVRRLRLPLLQLLLFDHLPDECFVLGGDPCLLGSDPCLL